MPTDPPATMPHWLQTPKGLLAGIQCIPDSGGRSHPEACQPCGLPAVGAITMCKFEGDRWERKRVEQFKYYEERSNRTHKVGEEQPVVSSLPHHLRSW